MSITVAMKEPKTARGRKTLRKLLDAAREEFGAKGFHDASVAGITMQAGIAQGTFYIYYESKEDIFRDLVLDLGRQLRDHLNEKLADVQGRIAAERIGLASFISFVRDNNSLYRIVMESQFVDEAVYKQYFTDFATAYTANLKEAEQMGEIRKGGCEERAWAIMGISLFLGLRYGIWDRDIPVDQVVDRVMDMMENGLKP